jgi:hypothetical protein
LNQHHRCRDHPSAALSIPVPNRSRPRARCCDGPCIPLLKEPTAIAGVAFDSVTAFLSTLAEAFGLFPDDGPDGTFGLLMSGLAGVAAAVAVAIALNVYFRARYRSAMDTAPWTSSGTA